MDNVLKDFSDKDTTATVPWSLSSRVVHFGEPYVFKRLYPTYLRMTMKQPVLENAENYLPVQVILKSYRDAVNLTYTLKDTTYRTDRLGDVRIYNQNGSFYAYRLIMSGSNQNQGSQIHEIDAFMEFRYAETRRRLDCSAQYLYSNGETGISICHCEGGGGTDAYFVHSNETGTLSEVVIHNLGKVPSVFVTDMEGYLIECGVQLILTVGQPDLFKIRLTFEEIIPYKAYFS
jgi:hypothetical protein